MEVRPLTDPGARSAACRNLAARLPDWFGIADANDAYARDIARLECYAVCAPDGAVLGMIALKPHFADAIEIFWMAVAPEQHRAGIGRAMVARAVQRAGELDRRHLIVATLGPDSGDRAYQATRAFYEALRFRPLCPAGHSGEGDALVWMIRSDTAGAVT